MKTEIGPDVKLPPKLMETIKKSYWDIMIAIRGHKEKKSNGFMRDSFFANIFSNNRWENVSFFLEARYENGEIIEPFRIIDEERIYYEVTLFSLFPDIMKNQMILESTNKMTEAIAMMEKSLAVVTQSLIKSNEILDRVTQRELQTVQIIKDIHDSVIVVDKGTQRTCPYCFETVDDMDHHFAVSINCKERAGK